MGGRIAGTAFLAATMAVAISFGLLVGCASQVDKDRSLLKCVENAVRSAPRDVYGDTLDGMLEVGAAIPVYEYNAATDALTRDSYDIAPVFSAGELVALCGMPFGGNGLYGAGSLGFRSETLLLEPFVKESGGYAFLRVGTGFSNAPSESIQYLVSSSGYVGYKVPSSHEETLEDVSWEIPVSQKALDAVARAGYSEGNTVLSFEIDRWWLEGGD